mgnify:FL=1
MAQISMDKIYETVINAYDAIAQTYTEAYEENDDMDSKYLEEFVSRLCGLKVLDMGCGTGGNTRYLVDRGLDVTGIDASEGMLNVAKKMFPELKFQKENILYTPFSGQIFDGVVLAYVINHFNPEGLSLLKKEINRLLKHKGVVFVSAHIGNSQGIVKDPLDDDIDIYYNFMSIDTLDKIFDGYKREYYSVRKSYGEEEFLCDKMFVVYRKMA